MSNDKNMDSLTLGEIEALLLPRQTRFVIEYEKDANATQAAIRAGYNKRKDGTFNERAASVTGSRLLRHANIVAYRRARVREIYNQRGITKESISLKLLDVYEKCMEGTSRLVWDSEVRGYVPYGPWSFDSRGATKALELLGKSIGMFEDKLDISGKVVVFTGEGEISD